ncbi:MAG TPA: sulfurtransferase TusA family protein, partial [Methanomassiliicoccaceae archaeon]|nr:sulfurtransferase TusA family protein [Methanomassiliicoccaceae archaeon]
TDDVFSHIMYPEVFAEFAKFTRDFGDMSVLPTPAFFYGMKVGEEVTMISDDIISKADVPTWCQRTGNELVEATEEDGIFTYRIRKSK